ncbi:hypothetical protein [Phaeocystidibacter marisrubri]|uniref:Uncharacterized protein n=1 Tax=Phaeocystidibacter marisrubri TaxID=1577780 RepID=A0A6L3ZHG7_9FLAO|nr:hypothetical protein [Phaeocystidibacter marisrubri]KAB2817079.1 hypothetical protein F8C82_01395 [Phaeocystidibacter marisrubri]GGH76947.1 hypothetical protein GCM10011318_25980 [Phaeocystidibacter marisrubri]
MPNYSVLHLEILLEVSAHKADVGQLDKGGFEKISTKIAEEVKGGSFSSPITPRYLQDLLSKLTKANEQSEESIGINQDYADSLSEFIGLKSFHNFQQCVEQWKSAFSQLALKADKEFKVNVVHNPADSIEHGDIQDALQKSNLKFIWVSSKDEGNLAFEDPASFHIILTGSNSAIVNEIQALPENASLPTTPIYLYHPETDSLLRELPVEWQKKPILNPQNIQVALAILHRITLYKEQSASKNERTNSVADSGLVILGENTQITAEYFSGRDMTININQKD